MKHAPFNAKKLIFLLISIYLLTILSAAFCEDQTIPALSSRNELFRQFMDNLEKSYMDEVRGVKIIPHIYTYTAVEKDTLITVAARCNIPIETLVLLNNFSSPDAEITGKKLYVPAAAGLFVKDEPASILEKLIQIRFPDYKEAPVVQLDGKNYYFIQSERLTPTERAFFYDARMSSPLPEGVLTSAYGMRISPISGQELFHKGIDLAAPEGTPVYACKSGEVLSASNDSTYGNFIILQHENNMQSVYAHLSKFAVSEGYVRSGTVIGYVGTTGLSTGPHLHFEIRTNGKNRNPQDYLP
ncbi:MAG: M23 family metallopeptidase [Treponemataceae bacterium]|nr:M23 family metallopeptidase [Treponemataceae bacterium]